MQATLIENNENGRIAYDSLMISKPGAMKVLGNDLALKILKELSNSPAAPIDVARKLKIHEQKIYYHIRKLEKYGFIYSVSTEKRHGMIANIYNAVAPVVATKLFERGTELKESIAEPGVSKDILSFFHPFIENGKLNAKIIIGAPTPHGIYSAIARHDTALLDFGIFLGRILNENDGFKYCIDTRTSENELKKFNLILIGNSKINSITQRINPNLPIYFDDTKDFQITSKLTGQIYNYDYDAVIVKTSNPLNVDKTLLLIAGKRSAGLVSAMVAIKNHMKEILQGNSKDKSLIAKVVSGLDKDSDGRIDSVKFLE